MKKSPNSLKTKQEKSKNIANEKISYPRGQWRKKNQLINIIVWKNDVCKKFSNLIGCLEEENQRYK